MSSTSTGWASLDACVLAMEGRPKDALAAAHRALEVNRGAGGSPSWVVFSMFEAASAAGGDDVRELLERLDELNPAELTRSIRAQQARFRARLPEYDAESELSTAERLLREVEAPFHLAVVQLEHAEWLTTQSRASEAEPLLTEARETFERLEAKPWLERTMRATRAGQIPESVT